MPAHTGILSSGPTPVKHADAQARDRRSGESLRHWYEEAPPGTQKPLPSKGFSNRGARI